METTGASYNTLSEAIEQSKAKGYDLDFDVKEAGIMEVLNHSISFAPDEVRIDEIHRFEGMSNPSDTSILYVLTTHTGAKGTMVDAYGADGFDLKSKFLEGAVDEYNGRGRKPKRDHNGK